MAMCQVKERPGHNPGPWSLTLPGGCALVLQLLQGAGDDNAVHFGGDHGHSFRIVLTVPGFQRLPAACREPGEKSVKQ